MSSGNFAEMATSTPFRDLLHAANLRHGTDGFTSPPKEGALRIFSPLKIAVKIIKFRLQGKYPTVVHSKSRGIRKDTTTVHSRINRRGLEKLKKMFPIREDALLKDAGPIISRIKCVKSVIEL
jgi:hypothetical protein